MKRSILFAAVLTLLVASTASADDKNVSLALAFTADSPNHFVGTFTFNGAVNESGPAEATVGTRTNDEGVLLLFANKTLYAAGGNIDLYMEGPLVFTGATTVSIVGKWHLTGGTGMYTDVKGHGTCTVAGDLATGVFSGAYVGKINVK